MRFSRMLAPLAATFVAVPGIAPVIFAATSGTSDVILQANATVQINIVDASITLSPSQTDYEAGYISAEGAGGIDVQLRTNSSTGAILKLKCADGSPQITLSDLLFKTQTAPGGSGSSQASYTAITGSDQDLWTTTTTSPAYSTIRTDVRVQNLWNYNDPGTAGTTDRTNTLTYTVIVQ
jgi:hypothetical protein